MGSTVEITGDAVGSFLVHHDTCPTLLDEDIKFLWSVTHVATGMRFPFAFVWKQSARAFAKDVESLMDWSAVVMRTSPDRGKVKDEWVSGKPTREQTAAIYEAAIARGAHIR